MSHFVTDEDAIYSKSVREWVIEQLGESAEFGTILRGLPGVDPGVVMSVLLELSAGDGQVAARAAHAHLQASNTPATRSPTAERPIPHPLDYYWGFDVPSVEVLTGLLAGRTGGGGTVAHLGTPNVFTASTDRLSDRRNVLLDCNSPVVSSVQRAGGEVMLLDLLVSPLPDLSAEAATIDPPWYPESMRGFLWAGATMMAVGGSLLASLLPVGTRPTAASELDDVLMWAADGGLSVTDRLPGAVRYVSAPFELASHRAAGIGGVPQDWRRGDLMIFELMRAFDQPRPIPAKTRERWLPFVLDEIPVRVRHRDSGPGGIGPGLLVPLVEGDVLQSVSRRDPLRERIDIWTSLNRVWSSSSPVALEAICRSFADEIDPVAAVSTEFGRALARIEKRHVSETATALREVVALERREHGL